LGDRLRRFVRVFLDGREEAWILRIAQDLVSAGDVTGKRERRNQYAEHPQDRQPGRIPSLGTQPKMKADAGVRP
jgi:hypothetical protein